MSGTSRIAIETAALWRRNLRVVAIGRTTNRRVRFRRSLTTPIVVWNNTGARKEHDVVRKTCAGHDVHPFKRSSRTLAHHVCFSRQSRRRGGIISFLKLTTVSYQPLPGNQTQNDSVGMIPSISEGSYTLPRDSPLDCPRLCSFTKIVLTSEYDSRVRLSGPNSRILRLAASRLWANPRQAPLELNCLVRKVRRGKGDYPPDKGMLPQRLYSRTEL